MSRRAELLYGVHPVLEVLDADSRGGCSRSGSRIPAWEGRAGK